MTRPIDLTRPDSFAGTIPDFFVVGHPKCGTTALHQMLKTHPEIYMPDRKEPWFFAEELHEATPPRPEGTPRTLTRVRRVVRAAPRRVRSSARRRRYYLWSQDGGREHRAGESRRAHRRDPARAGELSALAAPAAARSLYRGRARSRPGDGARGATPARGDRFRATRTSRACCCTRSSSATPSSCSASTRSSRPDQVKVLIYDDFRADNARTVRDVRRFLGVDDSRPGADAGGEPDACARARRFSTSWSTPSAWGAARSRVRSRRRSRR